jgi:hypothetical protein
MQEGDARIGWFPRVAASYSVPEFTKIEEVIRV